MGELNAMGRIITIRANENASRRRRLVRPASVLMVLLVVFGLAILASQAIIVLAGAEQPIHHVVTVHYEPVIVNPGEQPEVIKQFQIRDGELFNYIPRSGAENYTFDGWYTCNSDNPSPETRFNPNTPITENITLFAMWRAV